MCAFSDCRHLNGDCMSTDRILAYCALPDRQDNFEFRCFFRDIHGIQFDTLKRAFSYQLISNSRNKNKNIDCNSVHINSIE